VITSHKGDEDLQAKFSDFEDIIDRQEFIDEGEKYVNRFIRAAQRYLDENDEELEELQHLSQLAASGKSTKDDLKRIKALQTKLHISLDNSLGERKDWLDEYENRINLLEALKEDIETKLKNG
jgi:exonuclease VII large subunit